MSSKIPKQLKKFDTEQARMGMSVEKEHEDVTKGKKTMTAKIAAAHLKEDPAYYTKLKKMEESVQNDDQKYLDAVEGGDMEKAQKMVDAAAKAAGYNIGPVYHGTTTHNFTKFTPNKKGLVFVSPSYEWVKKWAGSDSNADIEKLFIKAMNLFDYSNNEHVNKLSIETSLGEVGRRAIKTGLWERLEDLTTIHAIKTLKFDGLYVKEDGIKNIAIFNPNQIKSADPVTYDDQGNIITLSKRFDNQSNDIRESIQKGFPKFESAYRMILQEISCWSGYKKRGTKIKNGKRVNNCVSINKNK